MGSGLAALVLVAAAAARPECPSAEEVASRLRALAPEAEEPGARIALEGSRLVVDAPGRPRLAWEMPAGDCAARADAAALVAARHLKSAPAWEPIAAPDPGEWAEWTAPATVPEAATEPVTATGTATEPVAAPVDTRAEIPKSPPLFRSNSFNDQRALGISGIDPWGAWLAVLGWPDLTTRPLSVWGVGRGTLFGGPPRGSNAASASHGAALRIESNAGPGYGWGPLLGVELSLGDGLSIPLFYGAAYRDRTSVLGYWVDVELSAQALAEITASVGPGAKLALNFGVNGEARARYEVSRGIVAWASFGVRTVWPGPTLGVNGDIPSLAAVAGFGLSLDPSLIPWR